MKMLLSLRTLQALVLAVPLALVATPAQAAKPDDASGAADASAKKKVGLGAFKGPKANDARGWVEAVLKDADHEVIDASDAKPGMEDKSYADMAKTLGVDAIVVGTVTKKFTLEISVYNAADGSALGDLTIKGGNAAKLKKAVQNELGIQIADPLSMAKSAEPEPEPEPEPEAEAPVEEAPAEEEPEEPDDEGPGGPSPFEIMVGLRAFHRNFEYTDSLSEVLPGRGIPPLYTYELPLGPAVLVDLRVYLFQFFTTGTLTNIGIQGHFEQGFATRSLYGEGTEAEIELETSAQEWRAGLRFRIPFSLHEAGIFAEYGSHKFLLSGDETVPLVPDVTYTFVRPGLDARFRFSNYMVGLHAAPRILLSMNELDLEGVWFPGATGFGLDAGLEFGYSIIPSLDIVVSGDFVRYGFDFNAIPDNNPVVAGGATDTYISGALSVLYRLPGGE